MEAKLKQCLIEGCDGEARAKGLCSMHYYRMKKGITDMRPSRLDGWNWSKRPIQNRPCAVEGCNRTAIALGYCRNHHAMFLRKGSTNYYRDIPRPKCSVEGCNNLANSRRGIGLCKRHYIRKVNGVQLDRPLGIKGELNPRWNGGKSQYPNHYTMKKIRKVVLAEENYTCYFCGKPAKQIHHLDHSKSNHSRTNLVACCNSCNLLIAGQHKSKYKNAYGMKLVEIAKRLRTSTSKVIEMHRNNKLRQVLSPDEVNAVLF